MTEDDQETAHYLKEELSSEIHAMLERRLGDFSAEIDEEVRLRLGEQFRFW